MLGETVKNHFAKLGQYDWSEKEYAEEVEEELWKVWNEQEKAKIKKKIRQEESEKMVIEHISNKKISGNSTREIYRKAESQSTRRRRDT